MTNATDFRRAAKAAADLHFQVTACAILWANSAPDLEDRLIFARDALCELCQAMGYEQPRPKARIVGDA